jgi:hypothetical protein
MDIRTPPPARSDSRRYGAHTIAKPTRTEGIGNALRAAFDASQWGVPDDMRSLLAKLDG